MLDIFQSYAVAACHADEVTEDLPQENEITKTMLLLRGKLNGKGVQQGGLVLLLEMQGRTFY